MNVKLKRRSSLSTMLTCASVVDEYNCVELTIPLSSKESALFCLVDVDRFF